MAHPSEEESGLSDVQQLHRSTEFQTTAPDFARFVQFFVISLLNVLSLAGWQEIYINLLQFSWQRIKRQTIYGIVCSVLSGQELGGGHNSVYINMHIGFESLESRVSFSPSHQSRNAERIHLFSRYIYQSRSDLSYETRTSATQWQERRQREETIQRQPHFVATVSSFRQRRQMSPTVGICPAPSASVSRSPHSLAKSCSLIWVQSNATQRHSTHHTLCRSRTRTRWQRHHH